MPDTPITEVTTSEKPSDVLSSATTTQPASQVGFSITSSNYFDWKIISNLVHSLYSENIR